MSENPAAKMMRHAFERMCAGIEDLDLSGLPEDAEVNLTDSPLKGEKWGVSWEGTGDYPTYRAYGDTPEEAIRNARIVWEDR